MYVILPKKVSVKNNEDINLIYLLKIGFQKKQINIHVGTACAVILVYVNKNWYGPRHRNYN